jgi:hypothetical protein
MLFPFAAVGADAQAEAATSAAVVDFSPELHDRVDDRLEDGTHRLNDRFQASPELLDKVFERVEPGSIDDDFHNVTL